MSTRTTTKKVWIAASVLLVVLVLSIGLHVVIARQHAQVLILRDDVARAAREDLVSLKRAIRAFSDERVLLDSILVDQTNMFSFLDDLTRLAEAQGATATIEQLVVHDIGTDGAEYAVDTIAATERSHGRMTLTLRTAGSWEEVTSTLLALEQLPRQATIASTRFASVYDQNGGVGGWVALFEIVVTLE